MFFCQRVLTSVAGLLFSVSAFAQSSGARQHYSTFTNDAAIVKFATDRADKPFALRGAVAAMGGRVLEPEKAGKPQMIFLGFYGCHPCEAELPMFMDLARQEKYKGYTFSYMTINDSLTAMREFDALHIDVPANVNVFCNMADVIKKYQVAEGYPVVYILDKNYTVSYIELGQYNQDKDKELSNWFMQLDAVK